MSDCIFNACDLGSESNENDLIHQDLQKQITDLLNTTNAKLLMFEGKLSELCVYIKENLSNSLRCLLYDMKHSGELDDIITEAVMGSINVLEMKTKDFVTPEMYGATANQLCDDTAAFQKAINFAALNGKALYIPAGQYRITKTLTLPDTLNIYGDGQSTQNTHKSTILFDAGNSDIPLFDAAEGVTQLGRCTFQNITMCRKRTSVDGIDTNELCYGRTGTCIGFNSNETSFHRCTFVGFNVVIERASITDFIDCDIVYCNSILSNTTLCNSVNFYGGNVYACGTLLKAYGNISTMNFTNCWIEDFESVMETDGVSVLGLNFTGCTLTNTVKGKDLIVFTASPSFARMFINFTDCLVYSKTYICSFYPKSVELAVTFNNSTVYYGGEGGESTPIYGNAKFLTMTGANTDVISTNTGFDTRSCTAHAPITLSRDSQSKPWQLSRPNNFIETRDSDMNRMIMLPVYYEFITPEQADMPRYFVFNTQAVKTGDWVLKFVYKADSGTIEKTVVSL